MQGPWDADGAPRWRWEWRIVTDSPLGAVARPYEIPGSRQAGAETYLLTEGSPHNVKIRGGRLEVKRLTRTSADGLQQWRPTIATEFPVDEAAAVEACDALRVPSPGVALPRVTREMLIAHLRSPARQVREVAVTKERTRLRVAGCDGEHVVLSADGRRLESLAFESPDPDDVRRAVALLGFDTRNNCSYPAALKRAAGLTPIAPFEVAQEHT